MLLGQLSLGPPSSREGVPTDPPCHRGYPAGSQLPSTTSLLSGAQGPRSHQQFPGKDPGSPGRDRTPPAHTRAPARSLLWAALPARVAGTSPVKGHSQTPNRGFWSLGGAGLGAGRAGACPDGTQEGARPCTPAGKPPAAREKVTARRRDIYTLGRRAPLHGVHVPGLHPPRPAPSSYFRSSEEPAAGPCSSCNGDTGPGEDSTELF